MDDFFLIIENKIGAGFTQYEDTAGTTTQIELYDDYQKRQGTSYGGIVLLTHYTYPPADWKNPVVTWSTVHQWLCQKFLVILKEHKSSTSVLKYWTKNLIDFLEDNVMTGTLIELSDIIALPAYERLRQGMKQLGRLADHELNNEFGKSWRSFRIPHGKTSGDFSEPKFYGTIMTPENPKKQGKGVTADWASFVLWCGVLASKAYEIRPNIDGIPELSVGFGSWTQRPMNDQNCIDLKKILEDYLLSRTPNMKWSVEWQPKESKDESGLLIAQARFSLIDLHQHSGNDFWDDPARSFFKNACKAFVDLPKKHWVMIEKSYQ